MNKAFVQTISILLLGVLTLSCSKSVVPSTVARSYKTSSPDFSEVQNDENNLDLDNYLKRIAGVSVNGSGANATVTIRGISSVNLSNEPLFIVDGVPIISYSAAHSSINPMEIQRVQVLKNPADTGIYGVRGANGVIIITRKNRNQ